MNNSAVISILLTMNIVLIGILFHKKEFVWTKYEKNSLLGLMVLAVIAVLLQITNHF